MAAEIKNYQFIKRSNDSLDREFSDAGRYGKLRPGKTALFWKAGLKWYHIPFVSIQRIYRQVEPVYGKLCCGGRSYYIERLVLILTDGSELILHIGDDVKKEAEALLQVLKATHPELEFGKEA